MKHIKKIFESDKFTHETVLDYLESCFVDYIDQEYNFVYHETIQKINSLYLMKVDLGRTKDDFNKIAELGTRLTEISEDFEANMRKVNIEYPNFTYNYKLTIDYGYLYVILEILPKR